MQIHNDIEQGSPEWFAIRAGKPTASCFDKVLTPTGRPSSQADVYINTLLAEIVTGGSVQDWEGNQWTERGNELEPEAVLYYELQKNITTEKVGFVTNYGVGCSPDRFVGDDGLLEIKCPKASTQIGYLLNNKLEPKYIPQIQGQLYVTGRKWCDWLAYSDELPSLIIRVERDEQYINSLAEALQKLIKDIDDKKNRLVELGYLNND